MSVRSFTLSHGGVDQQIELNREILDLTSDLELEAGTVAGTIGLVGEIIADTAESYSRADAQYRNWRGIRFLAAKNPGDGRKPPSDETSAKIVEADDEFLVHKNGLAHLEGDLEYLRAFMDALRYKASMIRARTELQRNRGEGESVGLDTRSDSRGGRPLRETSSDRGKLPPKEA